MAVFDSGRARSVVFQATVDGMEVIEWDGKTWHQVAFDKSRGVGALFSQCLLWNNRET